MAAIVPVRRAAVSTPVPMTVANLTRLPGGQEKRLDFQRVAMVLVKFAVLIWPGTGLVAGLGPSWKLPGVKILCFNLTPVAATRDTDPSANSSGVLIRESRLSMCVAMSHLVVGRFIQAPQRFRLCHIQMQTPRFAFVSLLLHLMCHFFCFGSAECTITLKGGGVATGIRIDRIRGPIFFSLMLNVFICSRIEL